MGKLIDLTGRKFGRLTVITFDHTHNCAYWLCRCDCGKEKVISGQALLNGSTVSCGCYGIQQRKIAKHKTLVGKRFGRLYVLEECNTRSNNGGYIYKCVCDCGNIKEIMRNSLASGQTTSCGCYHREKVSRNKGGTPQRGLYYKYKASARQRNLEFDIPEQMFYDYISQNCYYCGKPPSTSFQTGIYQEPILFTGIDRIDSAQGYLAYNIRPCCKLCNSIKSYYDEKEFLNWINKVYLNLTNKGIIDDNRNRL